MAILRTVQRKIQEIEGFQIRFRDRLSGRDVNDNLGNVPRYPYQRMARNSWTVAGWKRLRFRVTYPGFNVDVVYADGAVCGGNARLASVRDTYLD